MRSPPESVADLFLLIGALEIEPGHVGPGVHLAAAHLERVVPAGDFLEDRFLGVERVAILIDVAQLDRWRRRAARPRRAFPGPINHAEQRRLAGAVGADDADDAAGRQAEAQVLDQQLVAVALADTFLASITSSPRCLPGGI